MLAQIIQDHAVRQLLLIYLKGQGQQKIVLIKQFLQNHGAAELLKAFPGDPAAKPVYEIIGLFYIIMTDQRLAEPALLFF